MDLKTHLPNQSTNEISSFCSSKSNAHKVLNENEISVSNAASNSHKPVNFRLFQLENEPVVSSSMKILSKSGVNDLEDKSKMNLLSDENRRQICPALEDKTNVHRKNIRDVLGDTQLDTDTIAAQRLESERLQRVAKQQKIIREYQRQTAVNRQIVRTESKVLSLLQCGTAYATPLKDEKPIGHSNVCPERSLKFDPSTNFSKSKLSSIDYSNDEKTADDENELHEVVTIEDSSSEDDCILLSDDEDAEEEVEDDFENSGLHVKDSYNVRDEFGRVIVNVGHPEDEEDIFMAPQIARIIKPHQIGGVRFLYDNIIESKSRFETSTGFGCILAHSMGLGKTLQVVCFCDIFFRHTNSKTILCVMPINTLQNWVVEFNKWAPPMSENHEISRPRKFDVFVLNDQQKTLHARAKIVLKWAENGGVLLIGYELFRLLALKLVPPRKRKTKNTQPDIGFSESNKSLMERVQQALLKPGPDLVICDEGHRIKNAQAGISLALKQIRTRRRIVLTGYPLQNNLLEYWCMVDFVRPNYLGTRTEFCNMFERPIQNGQCIDSTPKDIKLMRYRAHVLHSLLLGFVQRRSHLVLQQTLPKKFEYVILTKMTAFQRLLYETFMNDVVRSKTVPNPLKAFAVCCKIWNHPDILHNFLKRRDFDIDFDISDPPSYLLHNSKYMKNNKNDDNFNPNSKDIPICKTMQLQAVTGDSKHNENSINIQDENKNMSKKIRSSFIINNITHNNTSFETDMFEQSKLSCDASVPSYTSTNKYWPANSDFFEYPINSLSTGPDYIGIFRNKECKEASQEKEGIATDNCSSEIVDMDTKEIKTVVTNINLQTSNLIIDSTPKLDDPTFEYNINKTKDEETIEKDYNKLKNDESVSYEWALELMKRYKPGLLKNSPKMEVMFCILNESITMGDRILLFSQSILTLNLIEQFLTTMKMPNSDLCWIRNSTYFRLDGSTASQEREKLVNEFNSNGNVKLFLISTRAGSLGINLIGANRVIVFDASWNPCHDTQAVYRVYRYGQIKTCYIYRIVMDKCLEKKIYDRQIKKQGMSDRVVDECNPDAHLSFKDITNLCHDYDDKQEYNIEEPFIQSLDSYSDPIVKNIVENYRHNLSKEPFYHESLLIDRKEKKLSQAEKRQAHRGYEIEKRTNIKNNCFATTTRTQYKIVRNDGTVISRPVASVRPMQVLQSNSKHCSIRSARWIPAEVWQRQGMTAQEMVLPLDVVIPTNSSDKSDIILKSGQRVMVLKSAKGIYMQLESGKIIAIRTSTKTNESNKNKEEIIDITSDGEGPSSSGKKDDVEESSCNDVIEEQPKICETTGDTSTDISQCYNNQQEQSNLLQKDQNFPQQQSSHHHHQQVQQPPLQHQQQQSSIQQEVMLSSQHQNSSLTHSYTPTIMSCGSNLVTSSVNCTASPFYDNMYDLNKFTSLNDYPINQQHSYNHTSHNTYSYPYRSYYPTIPFENLTSQPSMNPYTWAPIVPLTAMSEQLFIMENQQNSQSDHCYHESSVE